MTYEKSYAWAVNKVKLQQSIEKLETDKKIDPKLEITEDTILAEYRKRAGLVDETKVGKKGKKEEEESTLPQEPEAPAPKKGKN